MSADAAEEKSQSCMSHVLIFRDPVVPDNSDGIPDMRSMNPNAARATRQEEDPGGYRPGLS